MGAEIRKAREPNDFFINRHMADLICSVLFCVRKDDLVVGAPFYFERGVGGAIYVYLSDGHQVCMTVVSVCPSVCDTMHCG